MGIIQSNHSTVPPNKPIFGKITTSSTPSTTSTIRNFLSKGSSRRIAPHDGNNLLTIENEKQFHNELSSIRQSIRTNGCIQPQEKIVFILFAPPEYPTINAAEYLSKKINLPVIYPSEFIEEDTSLTNNQLLKSQQELDFPNEDEEEDDDKEEENMRNNDTMQSSQSPPQPTTKPSHSQPTLHPQTQSQLQTTPQTQPQQPTTQPSQSSNPTSSLSPSLSSLSSSSSSSSSPPPLAPSPPQRITNSAMINLATRTLLKKSSSIHENKTRCNLYERLLEEDCSNGFILYEYPDTITEMKYFKTQLVPHMRVELIFLQLNSDVMRTLQYKFDRWIHLGSGRSYHMIFRPPKSISTDLRPPTQENMIDDVTGEPLVQLNEDLPSTYKEKFQNYQIKEIPMFYEFEENAHEVPGAVSEAEVHKYLIKVVYNLTVDHLKTKYSYSQSSTLTSTKFNSLQFPVVSS